MSFNELPTSSGVAPERHTPPPFPLFINLNNAHVTVVGAGEVAERKIASLVAHGARLTVVAPEATAAVQQQAQAGKITWHERAYQPGDLAGALIAVGATSDRAVNEAVYAEATERNILVNVVDVPDLCNAIVPAVVARGNLQIAISTAGTAPSVARELRRKLEANFPAYWEHYLDVLGAVRKLVQARVAGSAHMRAPLYEAVTSSNLLERMAAGENPSAEEVYREIIEPMLAPSRQSANSQPETDRKKVCQ